VLAVYAATRRAIERARKGDGPTLIEADTMRMRGHAEHDDMKYVPKQHARGVGAKDPIARYEAHLVSAGAARPSSTRSRPLERELEQELPAAEGSPFPDRLGPVARLRRPRDAAPTPRSSRVGGARAPLMPSLTYLEAIRLAMLEEMQTDERVFVIGEDVGSYGGAFRVTQGFLERSASGA
jgi:hypothetical protein